VFWYFRTAFLQESHHAGSKDLRSMEMILHRAGAATQGGFSLRVHSTLYAREASVAPATPFKRRSRKSHARKVTLSDFCCSWSRNGVRGHHDAAGCRKPQRPAPFPPSRLPARAAQIRPFSGLRVTQALCLDALESRLHRGCGTPATLRHPISPLYGRIGSLSDS